MRIILLSVSQNIKTIQAKSLSDFYVSKYYDWRLLDDNAVAKVAEDVLAKPTWIIDSFPRNLKQAQMITDFDFAIYLKLPKECEKLEEVIRYFQQQNRLTTLNAQSDAETLTGEILDAILPF
jgi:adenylate kinase family enzyme